jgi:hypothetical protein
MATALGLIEGGVGMRQESHKIQHSILKYPSHELSEPVHRSIKTDNISGALKMWRRPQSVERRPVVHVRSRLQLGAAEDHRYQMTLIEGSCRPLCLSSSFSDGSLKEHLL